MIAGFHEANARVLVNVLSTYSSKRALCVLTSALSTRNSPSRPDPSSQLLLPVNCKQPFTTVGHYGTRRYYRSKIESYFSAIGGDSDEPPPTLTPQQVTNILKSNEITINKCISSIERIECNQLAANHPVEDRLRVSKLYLNGVGGGSNTMLMAVFDGHGGGLCADVVANRLFHYIALSLCPNAIQEFQKSAPENVIQDLYSCPRLSDTTRLTYEARPLQKIREVTLKKDMEWLSAYAEKMATSGASMSIEQRLKDAFVQCDTDLSTEIQQGLLTPISNVLTHYYLSLAASGCCVSLLLMHDNQCFLASTGDCRAVIGFKEATPQAVVKSMDLNNEHNSDNVAEIKRLFSAHPPAESKTIIKNDRLLSYLMPFRAFGDFCYKWPVDLIHKVGLTRAFGSHIIPPHYYTPPYLIAEPEVTCFPVNYGNALDNRYVVIATDGLWELFGTSRCVLKQVVKHNQHYHQLIDVNTSEKSTDSELPEFLDENCCTHLLRSALNSTPMDYEYHSLDAQAYHQQQHMRLVSFLTLPAHAVRNFRDDISLIVLQLNSSR